MAGVFSPRAEGAAGVYRNGVGARSMALGGVSTANSGEPFEALAGNPAGLGTVERTTFQVGGWGAVARGEFSNSGNRQRDLGGGLGAAPEAAIAHPLGAMPLPMALGLGVFADSAARLDGRFVDASGGADGYTSYGRRKQAAEFLAIRTSLGASVKVNESLSLGALLGVVYNRNSLEAPYVFQRHPALRGLKTLLDLETDGWGINGTLGLLYRASEEVSLGVSYRSPTRLTTDGRAAGNAGVQLQNLGPPFDGVEPEFRYDARVVTELPQVVSAGAAWQLHRRARAVVQVDWINWSDSFDRLDVALTRGNNADLNAFLSSNRIDDQIPLRWKDRFVYRGGLEFTASDSWLLRAGYAYGASPVPDSFLTPISAAILEHSVTAGLEWNRGRYSVAGAYQYDFASTATVGTSALRSGEYSGSRTRLSAHWFGLTTGVRF